MPKRQRVPILALISVVMTLSFAGPKSAIAQSAPANRSSDHSRLTVAEARRAVEEGEAAWARARLNVDTDTFQKMLAPEFYAQLPNTRLTRDEFLKRISDRSPDSKLKKFDNEVLTMQQQGEAWVALIVEKFEYPRAGAPASSTTDYYLAVTRDGWEQFGDQWKVLFSEVVGLEKWSGERPPIKNW